MAVIRILSDQVANQIAAGEVIERPAAVVKELIENSLDADASRVEVEFRSGGRSLIRVEDNGRGMSPEDALLSLERHATSKITQATDLNRVGTLGFRGEALPSIASVSRFQLQTRREEDGHGTEILVNGGKFIHVRECGMPPGTRVEVSQLFNSVPARRKFLKTDATESAHIIQCVRLHAIANPSVAFRLIENGRVVFQTPSCPGLAERLGEIFGRGMAERLAPVSADEGDLRLRGLIGRPPAARSTRHEMVTFVNRRPVESRTLAYALLESFQEHLPKGRYPMAFLFLNIDPAGVDVNVHPAKREIRFRDEGRVRRFVIRALLEKLREPMASGSKPPDGPPPSPAPARGDPAVSPPAEPGLVSKFPAPAMAPPAARLPADISSARVTRPAPSPNPPLPPKPTGPTAPSSPQPGRGEAVASFPQWRLLGSARGGLAVFETATGLVLLDRRAAHERVLFEEILAQYRRGPVPGQALLFPVPLELDPVSTAMLADHLDFLNRGGFEISPFGRNVFRIEAVPAWLEPTQCEDFVRDLIGVIRERGLPEDQPDLARERLAGLVCRRAVRGGEGSSEEELTTLVRRLLRCDNPLTSPRGTATFFEMPAGEIEKRLKKG